MNASEPKLRVAGWPSRAMAAFTLVEVLVATAVLAMVLGILLGMTNAVSNQVRSAASRTESFRSARNAFESLTRQISQATLNTYWDYQYTGTGPSQVPTKYVRQSELRFISGPAADLTVTTEGEPVTHAIFFQAPLGQVDDTTLRPLDSLLNTWGYFVEHNTDAPYIPSFLSADKARKRFRLMELREPSENLTLYQYTSGLTTSGTAKRDGYVGKEWFTTPLKHKSNPNPSAVNAGPDEVGRFTRIVADNVIALVILPKLSKRDEESLKKDGKKFIVAPKYLYDSSKAGEDTGSDAMVNSKNQLPPLVEVSMIALDEPSGTRLEAMGGAGSLPLSEIFTDAANYDADLAGLEGFLNTHRLKYRTFSTDVQILASKWSTE